MSIFNLQLSTCVVAFIFVDVQMRLLYGCHTHVPKSVYKDYLLLYVSNCNALYCVYREAVLKAYVFCLRFRRGFRFLLLYITTIDLLMIFCYWGKYFLQSQERRHGIGNVRVAKINRPFIIYSYSLQYSNIHSTFNICICGTRVSIMSQYARC